MMTMDVWYTAKEKFDADCDPKFGWKQYLDWSKLTHLSEVVSLDEILNPLVFKPDFETEEAWEHVVVEGEFLTPFYTSMDYVLQKAQHLARFNLLAVVKEPQRPQPVQLDAFDFVGYDLMEKGDSISTLTNCGGFDKSFAPNDLNEFGLVTDWAKARTIQQSLLLNYPEEHHTDCYLYAVWRHQTIGRKK